ncbi:MAG: CRISPR-associated endonuclease Cas6 [Rhabdochlamydiaceae bacterium]
MDSIVRICRCVLEANIKSDATSLRGYLVHLFVNDPEYHHHSDDPYHYPLVQYKNIKGKLIIIGIDTYAQHVFERISRLEKVILENYKASVNAVQIYFDEVIIKQQETRYSFYTPWIGLNQKNYKKFRESGIDKRKLLEAILVGNILSALKGMGIRADFRIQVSIQKFRSIPQITRHQGGKKNKFAGFYCNFNSNILLPEFIGLGKSVSKGFGVIERIK